MTMSINNELDRTISGVGGIGYVDSKVVAKSRITRIANSPRMDRRRARTRETLIAAAQSLFASRAVEAVSIDDIADTADVAKGTFYNHFGDKDAIAAEVFLNVRRDVELAIGVLNNDIADAATRVARALACVLNFALLNPDRARALLRIRMYPPATGSDSSINAGLRHDIEAGMESEQFQIAAVEIGVTLVCGITDAGLTQILDHVPPNVARSFGRDLGVGLLRALGVRPATALRIASEAIARVM